MAAYRPVGRAAYSIVRNSSPLCNVTGPTYLLRMPSGSRLLAGVACLLHQPRPLQFAVGACGYCSQQIAHSSSTTHTCTSIHTPIHTPTQTPLQSVAAAAAAAHARRINRRTEVDFEELRALQLAGDIALIDVRDSNELQNYGEIPGSLNIPLCKIKAALQLTEDEFEQEFSMEKPDKGERNLVFYARGPNASSAAVEIAHRLGFNRSRHYIGGWEDYCRQTGMPLKKPQVKGINGPNFYVNRFDQHFL